LKKKVHNLMVRVVNQLIYETKVLGSDLGSGYFFEI
jgi:hypothetical protein